MKNQPDAWRELKSWFEKQFGMESNVDAMLFLVGVQQLGKGFEEFEKSQKLDLIHVGVCTILEGDYYRLLKRDKEDWPHFELIKKLPVMNAKQQDDFIKKYLLAYFKEYQSEVYG